MIKNKLYTFKITSSHRTPFMSATHSAVGFSRTRLDTVPKWRTKIKYLGKKLFPNQCVR